MFWLRSIANRGGSSSCLLVGTHAGCLPQAQSEKRCSRLILLRIIIITDKILFFFIYFIFIFYFYFFYLFFIFYFLFFIFFRVWEAVKGRFAEMMCGHFVVDSFTNLGFYLFIFILIYNLYLFNEFKISFSHYFFFSSPNPQVFAF